jgi:hypothetical protein
MTHQRVVVDEKFSLVSHHPISAQGFDASLIRWFPRSTGISVPRGLHKSVFASAKRWQSRAFHYRTTYLYPLGARAPSRPSPRWTSNTPSHASLSDPSSASCSYFVLFDPRSTSTLDRGDRPGFRYLPHSYRESENVPPLCVNF